MQLDTRPVRALLIAFAIIGMSACQQERNNAGAAAGVKDVPAAAVSAMTTAQPAQVPAGDPSLPPYGTPQSTASGVDGAHSVLTAGERDKALPLEGQANNYSSDASAKRGDEQIPRETTAAPRGDETVSTPNSYPKESK